MYVLVHCKSDDRNLFIVVIFTLQRSIEKSRLKRKLQKAQKRCKAKICKQAKDLVVVPSDSTDVIGQHQAVSHQSSTDQSSTSLVRKLSIGKRATEEVNAMLLANFKEKARKLRKAYECEDSGFEDVSDTTCRNESNHIDNIDLPTKEECVNSYLQLTKDLNAKSEFESDSSPSVLLPAYPPPLEKVNVQVKGNSGLTNMSAKHYIGHLIAERNDAVLSAQLFRNQVDQLRNKNRKLYCKMHDRIDTIRNFWRNNIAEGSSRAGLCVKMAVMKQKSQC